MAQAGPAPDEQSAFSTEKPQDITPAQTLDVFSLATEIRCVMPVIFQESPQKRREKNDDYDRRVRDLLVDGPHITSEMIELANWRPSVFAILASKHKYNPAKMASCLRMLDGLNQGDFSVEDSFDQAIDNLVDRPDQFRRKVQKELARHISEQQAKEAQQ